MCLIVQEQACSDLCRTIYSTDQQKMDVFPNEENMLENFHQSFKILY